MDNVFSQKNIDHTEVMHLNHAVTSVLCSSISIQAPNFFEMAIDSLISRKDSNLSSLPRYPSLSLKLHCKKQKHPTVLQK